MMRPATSILGLAILHFLGCWALLMILLSRALNVSLPATWIDTALGQALNALWFPFYPSESGQYIERGAIYENTLLFGVGLLWGLGVYLAIRLLFNRQRSN